MQRVRTIGSRLPLRCQGGKRGGRHGSRGWDWFYNALDERKVGFYFYQKSTSNENVNVANFFKQKPAKIPHALHFKPLNEHTRKKVYFNFEAEGETIGKITFELAVRPRFFFLFDDDGRARHTYT